MYSGDNKYCLRDQIANEFNAYLSSIGKNVSDSIPFIPKSYEIYLISNYTDSMFLKPTSVDEFSKICVSLNAS